MSVAHANYVLDLGHLVAELALEAKRERDESSEKFSQGRLMAYHEIVSLMTQQAHAFQIPLAEVGLNEIDADRDLL